jgi:adenylyltransferase/sulfurtransferase
MTSIDPIALQQLLKEDEIFLLDVREVYEHQKFNIGGILIPLGDLNLSIEQIPKHQKVVVYCKKGIRSQIAIQKLERSFGFTNLINLTGGMDAWQKLIGQE